jgi:hypothetical protein
MGDEVDGVFNSDPSISELKLCFGRWKLQGFQKHPSAKEEWDELLLVFIT